MHPLYDYIAKLVGEKLKSRTFLVFYDPREEFAPFWAEVRQNASSNEERPGLSLVNIGGVEAHLATFTGSMFELRFLVEPLVSGDEPEPVVLYLPGCERDYKGSVLMELEMAGEGYEPQLKRLARNVLRERFTDGTIDELLAREHVGYEDLARAMTSQSSSEPPSILKTIFHETSSPDALLALWLVDDARDEEIAKKDATGELAKLIASRLGLDLPKDAQLSRLRAATIRYVLASEFRSDLRCPPPPCLDGVPSPKKKEEESATRTLARRLRNDYPDEYETLADRVEGELKLKNARLSADVLGSIDTFRFEEKVLLSFCGELIADEKFEEAQKLIEQRDDSFWLNRAPSRKAQWEACRLMAELGRTAKLVESELASMKTRRPSDWIAAYTRRSGSPANEEKSPPGWHQLDRVQRRLEAWIGRLDEEPEERALGIIRRLYENACHSMANGFTESLEKAGWTTPEAMQQTRIFADIFAAQPKPVAYFLVDAMRFEMGVELSERLPKSSEVSVRHAVASLPSITTIGMAALQPGASASFDVVEKGGKLGARIEDMFLPDVTARKKLAAAKIPKLVDLTLDELLGLSSSKLAKKTAGAEVVVVRSQEIDHVGEAGFTVHARPIMDAVIDNLARAIRKLARLGIDHAVVTADHGHLFFAEGREESMRTDAPGGQTIELHRRCWIGRGGATPKGCIRVPASALGYQSDLDFVFPKGSGVFLAGGDLAFHHGGPSLQELLIPVLTIRTRVRDSAPPPAGPVTASGFPEAVTNRIITVTLTFGGKQMLLETGKMTVRPMLISGEKQVGTIGMATNDSLDHDTGCITLEPNRPCTVVFQLIDDSVPSLRLVVQDANTDAELYRSPTDIPNHVLR